MDMRYSYEPATETVRLMPANHLIAQQVNGRWVVDCDAAVEINIAVLAFATVHNSHIIRWGSGYQFTDKLNTLAGFR